MSSRFHLTGFGKRAGVAGAIVLALISAAPAVSYAVGFGNRQWTAIGSAGVAMGGGVTNAGTAAVLDSSSATVRYNVVAIDGLFATNPDFPFLATSTSMTARFLDPGNTSRVIVRLRRTDLVTSATSTLLTIDSNNFGGSNLYQNQTVGCGQGFDFSTYAYYVEVTLSRTADNASAGIASIQIGKADLCLSAAAN
ncbi:MAG: hypothetical protein ABI818_17930 [Acidobacteriota bacterium]